MAQDEQAVPRTENTAPFPDRATLGPATDANAVEERVGKFEIRAGDRLRAAREDRGATLADVSAATKIRQDYLRAIEDMYAPGIPRGYLNPSIRQYAKFLELPAQDLIDQFAAECGAVSQAPKADVAQARVGKAAGFDAVRAAGGGLVAGLVAVCAWFAVSFVAPDQTDPVALGEARNAAKESLFSETAPSRVAAQLPLRLVALRSDWIEIRGRDGTKIYSRNVAAGEDFPVRIGGGWTVSAQNGGAFEWRVGDVAIGLLGEDGAPVYAISVDNAAADAESAAAPTLAIVGEGLPTR